MSSETRETQDPDEIPVDSEASEGFPEQIEQESIRKCQSGDISGLEGLYRLYGEKVFRTCYRILGNHASAEDQTHEVFLRLYEQIGSFHGCSRFSTWLYRLTVNRTLNRLRSRLSQPASVGGGEILEHWLSGNQSPEDTLLLREKGDIVQALLSMLPMEQRTTIVLREIEGLSYAEIAEVLGVPVGTVMSRLHRARRGLKKHLVERNTSSRLGVLREEVRKSP